MTMISIIKICAGESNSSGQYRTVQESKPHSRREQEIAKKGIH